MGPLAMMAIGAGIGAGKAALFDAPKEKKQRELAAQTAIYSPWTGLNPMSAMPQPTDYFGSALQGGMAGGMMGQGMENSKQQGELLELQKKNLQQQNQAQMINSGMLPPVSGSQMSYQSSPWGAMG